MGSAHNPTSPGGLRLPQLNGILLAKIDNVLKVFRTHVIKGNVPRPQTAGCQTCQQKTKRKVLKTNQFLVSPTRPRRP